MRIADIKGLIVFTLSLTDDEAATVSRLADSEIIDRAKTVVGGAVSPELIKDILVGCEGNKLHVALSL